MWEGCHVRSLQWDPQQISHWIEAIPDGIIFYSGPQLIVTALNRTARAFLGDRPGIIGGPMREVYREDAVVNVISAIDKVYATGRWIRAVEWRVRGGERGRVRIEGTLDGGGRACMTVIDRGTWRQPDLDPGSRGRGLALMRGAMDAVEIERTAEGTTLLLDRQLSVPPVLGPAQPGRRTERLAGGHADGPHDGPS